MQYTQAEEKAFNLKLSAPAYRSRYRCRRGEDGIWEILCKHGDIEPYSLTELCCSVVRSRSVARIVAKLPSYCQVTQGGGADVVFKFPISKLDEIAVIAGAYKRRHLSPEQKAKNIARLQPFLFEGHAAQSAKMGNIATDRLGGATDGLLAGVSGDVGRVLPCEN